MKKALFFCFLFALCLTTAVRAQSPCEEPSNITITPGATSATVSWTGSSTQYNVQYSSELFYCGADVDCVSDWSTYDADGDGYYWGLTYSGRSGASDDIAFYSESYSSSYGALDPDNWLITPVIDLGGTMSVWMMSYLSSFPDNFAIYLTTNPDWSSLDDFTITLVPKTTAPSEWKEYTADLSAYAGMRGAIAIRHFESFDMWALLMDDFSVNNQFLLSNVSSPLEISGLNPTSSYQVQVQAVCPGSVSEWTDPVTTTTHGLCDAPYNVNLTEATSNTATIAWTGFQEQYTVRYQTLESFNALAGDNTTVTLTAGDVWGDGSGYQMLLDADATAYGTIIPESGGLTSSGDASVGVYSEFEYAIPENADGALNTSNIILDNSSSISIPAGTYDWCITNPTPGDRVWIASSNGTVGGREDDYVFEADKNYEFVVTIESPNDRVDVTITDALPESSWTTVTNASDPVVLTSLTPNTTYIMKVQGVCEDGVTAWSDYFQFTTADEVVPEIPGGCGLVTDCDGKKYPTIKIGDVCWMQKNLAAVSCVTSGNVYSYVNDLFPDEAANVATYGRLYDEAAVMQGIGAKAAASTSICPTGYRLPTVAEIEALGAAYSADELKSTDYWITGGAGSDISGFSWLPGGCYSSSKDNFESMLLEGYLWATEEVGGVVSPAMYKITYYCSTILMRVEDHTGLSASVRCVKEAEPTTFTCGASKMKDTEGHEYETVLIGTQCWTKSNLRVAAGTTGIESSNFSQTNPCYYVHPTLDANLYGYYYNWPAANMACPTGWHLPSLTECNEMLDYVRSQSAFTCGGDPDNISKALASNDVTWTHTSTNVCSIVYDQTNNNTTGFSAIPAGRSTLYTGDATVSVGLSDGYEAYFWLSTESGTDKAYSFFLRSEYSIVYSPDSSERAKGFSVRCVKD